MFCLLLNPVNMIWEYKISCIKKSKGSDKRLMANNNYKRVQQAMHLDIRKYLHDQHKYWYYYWSNWFLTWYEGCSSWAVVNSNEYKQHSSWFHTYNIWSLYAKRLRTVFAPFVSNIFLNVWNISNLFRFNKSVTDGMLWGRCEHTNSKTNVK